MRELSQGDLIRAEAQLYCAKLPSVFYLYCKETKGKTKYKYLVILSSDGLSAYYLMINSKQYFADGCEIPVTPDELPCLSRNSFIDCRELIRISREELIFRIAENIENSNRGIVPDALKLRISAAAEHARTLNKIEKWIIVDAMKSDVQDE